MFGEYKYSLKIKMHPLPLFGLELFTSIVLGTSKQISCEKFTKVSYGKFFVFMSSGL